MRYTTKVITQTIAAGASSFSVDLDIPHPVKDMNVKSLSFSNAGTVVSGIVEVRSDLYASSSILSFPNSSAIMETVNNPFSIHQDNIHSRHTFELRSNGSLFTSDGEIQISLTLCFVQD